MDEQRYLNQAADREQAEGSRETIETHDEQGSAQADRADESDENAGGITNRPLDAEIASQREVPPRGDAKLPGSDHA